MAPRFAMLLTCLSVSTLSAASYRTQNFIVAATTSEIAQQVGEEAEEYRRSLANEWLGEELPAWSEPCPVRVIIKTGHAATGETSFEFEGRRPTKWRMLVFGPLDRVLDSILPHEITHTIFATHFGRRLPPWIDEGACTVVEAESERAKLGKALRKVLPTQRRLSFERMFALREYPRDIVPLYVQGHALASYLIMQGGKQKFLRFVSDGLEMVSAAPDRSAANIWADTIREHYGYASLANLESNWIAWVNVGSPSIDLSQKVQLAATVPPAMDEMDVLMMDMQMDVDMVDMENSM